MSALSALILSGCSLPGLDFSLPNLSELTKRSETSSSEAEVSSSKEEKSSISSSVASSIATSSGQSSRPSSSSSKTSSSRPSSSSSSEIRSSEEEPEINFYDIGITGTFYGQEGTLVINPDNTTSWGTSSNSYPASVIEYENGVYHIVSDLSVISKYRVDVYTDGTTAYVIRNGQKYLMDKRATATSQIKSVKTDDYRIEIFAIEVRINWWNQPEWKYAVMVDGNQFYTNVQIQMILGDDFSVHGSLFSVITDAFMRTYINEGDQFISIYNVIENVYQGVYGDLHIYTTQYGELISAKIEGETIDARSLNGNVLAVGDEEKEYEVTEDDIICHTTKLEYSLNGISKTYSVNLNESSNSIVLDMNGTYGETSGIVGEDGHLWAKFTAPANGVLEINETIALPGTDSFLCLYEMGADQDYSQSNDAVSTINERYNLVNGQVEVIGGVTYLIKISHYSMINDNYTATGYPYAGSEEAFDWNFTTNTREVFTGFNGDLVIESNSNGVCSISVDGRPLSMYTISGDEIAYRYTIYDSEMTPLTFVAILTLDRNNNTYEYLQMSESMYYPFETIELTDTSYDGYTDESGSVWVKFTPTVDGLVSITETNTGTIDDTYLALYDLTALDGDISKLGQGTVSAMVNSNAVAFSDATPAIISDASVIGGHTYVIKHGAYQARNIAYGESATNPNYVNSQISFDFSFNAFSKEAFQGNKGTLVIFTKNGDYHHATLNGEIVSVNSYLEGDVLCAKGSPDYDFETDYDNPTMSSLDTLYTVDRITGTYSISNAVNTTYVVHEIKGDNEHVQGVIGPDGNIWASFTPSEDGYISIDETVQATNGINHDTLLAVYEKRESGASWSDYAGYASNTYPTGSLSALNSVEPYRSGSDNRTDPVYVHDLPVQAGKTYIIKIGCYNGNALYIGSTGNTTVENYVGSLEAFNFSFYKADVRTYTGDEGDLELTFLNGALTEIKINGTWYTNKSAYDEDANELILYSNVRSYDFADPLDPLELKPSVTYSLNDSNGTYDYLEGTTSIHLFGEIEEGVEYHGVTGDDGCYYAKYVAEEDGSITISEIEKLAGTSYIAVYEAKPENVVSNYKGGTNSSVNNYSLVGYSSVTSLNNYTTPVINVEAGKTYIIKVSDSNGVNKAPGERNTNASAIDKAGSILLTFTPLRSPAFGEYGYLQVNNDGTVLLDGVPLNNPIISSDGRIVSTTGDTFYENDGDPYIERQATTYTISEDGERYTTELTQEIIYIYSLNITDEGTYYTTSASNGLGLAKFVAPTDGVYTISVLMSGVDNKLGIYYDSGCTQLVTGTTDSKTGSNAESITFTATAGTTYYIKTGYWSNSSDGFNNAISKTDSKYGGKQITITVQQGSGQTPPSSNPGDYGDDYYDDWY